ncbi:MAG: methylmalonyl Co-A mutase-associated GTPase MeaB [Pseudomonadota bacterium]
MTAASAPAQPSASNGEPASSNEMAHALVDRLQRGERRAVADALTDAERGGEKSADLMKMLRPHIGGVGVLGVTGPPGAGKSTLVNALAEALATDDQAQGLAVGILAVDPSSPVSGGAILGDRLRMTSANQNRAIFVRSLSAGGHLGGLSPAAARMIDVMDVAGFHHVIIETVGIGQSEVDIAAVADLRLVIAAPGLGDDIQAMKSGLLEIADIVAVNKSDRPGAEQTRQQLAGSMSLKARGTPPPVLAVSAQTGSGLNDLCTLIRSAMAAKLAEPLADRRRRRARYLLAQSANRVIDRALNDADRVNDIDALAGQLLDGEIDPVTATARLLKS